MRPPYGGTKPGINAALLKRLGLQAVLWDVDTNDWSRPPPEQILRTVESTKRGSIILCHDVMPGTLEVLSQLIDVVRGKGFDFITISRGIENKETD